MASEKVNAIAHFSKSVIFAVVVLSAFLMVIQEEHIRWDLHVVWQISTVIFIFPDTLYAKA